MSTNKTLSIADATSRWLQSNRGLSASTCAAYKGELSRLGEYLAHRKVTTLTSIKRSHWWSYVAALEEDRPGVESKRKAKLKSTSSSQAKRITRSFFYWALEEGWIGWVPRLPTAYVSEYTDSPPQWEPPLLNDELVKILLGNAEPSSAAECRSHFVFNLVFWGTLKPSELVQLRAMDIGARVANGKVTLTTATRTIQLPTHLLDQWRLYRDARRRKIGTTPGKTAPLVAQLADERSLSPREIWSIFDEWRRNDTATRQSSMSPRLLRQAYINLAAEDAMGILERLRFHTGLCKIPISVRPPMSIERGVPGTRDDVQHKLTHIQSFDI
ncbi:MAG: hypothetical protein JWN23_960 [Rhodocyclales bacterium]|nr:hypothetical protein [Rhodocyclales bacterium]